MKRWLIILGLAAGCSTVLAQAPERSDQSEESANILDRAREIMRLEGDLDRYTKYPRRKFIGARTQEYRFARYIENWRVKVERVGEMNYPQAARDYKIYGNVVVTVSIKSDGSLEGVEINRSSGLRLLDEAAVRIAKLAAPYAPFPDDIAKDTDVLSIVRTWTFTRSDQFVAE